MSQPASEDALRRAHLERFEGEQRHVHEALADAGVRIRHLLELINRRDLDYGEQVSILIECYRATKTRRDRLPPTSRPGDSSVAKEVATPESRCPTLR
jgi:hypothetical protein